MSLHMSTPTSIKSNKNKKKMKQTCLPIWILKPLPGFHIFFYQTIYFINSNLNQIALPTPTAGLPTFTETASKTHVRLVQIDLQNKYKDLSPWQRWYLGRWQVVVRQLDVEYTQITAFEVTISVFGGCEQRFPSWGSGNHFQSHKPKRCFS